MEISHFELIYKPQAPVGPGGVGAVDTVLQGYFLEITNLEAEEYRYRLAFVAVPPAAGQTQRSLEGNTLVFIDTPGVDNDQGFLAGAFADTVFVPSQGDVVVPAHATALVAVLPSVFGVVPADPTPIPTASETYEVRGYVRITLPALPSAACDDVLEPQATHPVRVMLTPQNRTTYYRRTLLGTDVTTISDQTQATLTMAPGKGRIRLRPEPGGAALAASPAARRRVLELA